jgi:hypothetical protein
VWCPFTHTARRPTPDAIAVLSLVARAAIKCAPLEASFPLVKGFVELLRRGDIHWGQLFQVCPILQAFFARGGLSLPDADRLTGPLAEYICDSFASAVSSDQIRSVDITLVPPGIGMNVSTIQTEIGPNRAKSSQRSFQFLQGAPASKAEGIPRCGASRRSTAGLRGRAITRRPPGTFSLSASNTG